MYKNWIFDLYGTLISVHTDEGKALLWEKMSDFYACYGSDYTPDELREAYWRICHEEENEILKKGCTYAEIDLEKVFVRLLKEAPRKHRTEAKAGSYKTWAYACASMFRVISREWLGNYEHTLSTLQALKDRGCRIYLLSNAQHLFTVPEMEICGLTQFFDRICISSDAGVRKPDPLFLDQLLRNEKLDKTETILVGNDFSSDIASAIACGIDSVFLNTDHYVKMELERRLSQVRLNMDYNPYLIESGDIAEILAIGEGDNA